MTKEDEAAVLSVVKAARALLGKLDTPTDRPVNTIYERHVLRTALVELDKRNV